MIGMVLLPPLSFVFSRLKISVDALRSFRLSFSPRGRVFLYKLNQVLGPVQQRLAATALLAKGPVWGLRMMENAVHNDRRSAWTARRQFRGTKSCRNTNIE